MNIKVAAGELGEKKYLKCHNFGKHYKILKNDILIYFTTKNVMKCKFQKLCIVCKI